jgi:HTH-type transcriptional regulator, glycine betaine synthesis regulator
MHPDPQAGSDASASPVEPADSGDVSASGDGSRGLSDVQVAIIDVFSGAAVQLGLPKSLGQIYGLLYASPRPLPFREIADLLEISAGSASQGIRLLRGLGAIKPVEVAGDRREHFAPELSLRRLLGGVLKTRVQGPLDAGAAKIEAISMRLDRAGTREPDAEFLKGRLESIKTWHRKATLVLPLLRTFLGSQDT